MTRIDLDEAMDAAEAARQGSASSKIKPIIPKEVDDFHRYPSDIIEKSNKNHDEPITKINIDQESGVVVVQSAEQCINRHTDPFATREGKTLTWTNVNMVLTPKGGEGKEKKILSDVWGEVPPRKTTAIMGPSGAGKTSLLNILSGRTATRGRIKVDADVRLNNYSVDPTNIEVRHHIAFVAQEDSLQVTATPREAIHFSAKLRLPRSTSEQDLEQLVERMLTELGLTSCADTMVGGMMISGISGGERKRTSVGVELVVKPELVFLDEPTSGLDSFSAVQVCQVLKKVANAGASVLFTIHQPSSEIFASFDHLILMNRGGVMYEGDVADVPEYFAARNQPMPPNFNPADWIMQVAQVIPVDELKNRGFYPKDNRNMGDVFVPNDRQDALGITISKRSDLAEDFDERTPGLWTQIQMLFTRELRSLRRDKIAVAARFGITIFMCTLIGIIFFGVGGKDPSVQTNVQSHFGATVVLALTSMFGTAQPALLAFPEERPVFLREYSTNHYSVFAYFLARYSNEAFITAAQCLVMVLNAYWLIDFQGGFGMFFAVLYSLAMASTALGVFIGSALENPKLGQEMLPLLIVPQMLFAGFFVTPDLMPVWLRWARYLCTLTYAVRIILVAEFEDCAKTEINCERVLVSVEADPDETWWNWLVLILLFIIFRLLALYVLQRKATKFF